MQKRLIVLLALVGCVALVAVTTGRRNDGGVRVQAGGDPTSEPETSTTQTPVTTSTTDPPTTAPTTTEVVTTTEPPTTVPPTDPPTTPPPPPPPPATTAKAPLKAQEVAPVGAGDPAPAVRTAQGVCMTDDASCHPPDTPPRQAWPYCEEWHDTAAAVGWPESAGRVLSGIIWYESRCNPNAHNPSGATGLTQLLGWHCSPSCYDPAGNLAEALVLYRQEGGFCPAWRGDPAVGRC